ncbi:hypothetical protein [Rhizobium gallicum]|uniref:hypothetical protein n=1 Tax=Rhizobium gallicum TaxID=56730 RepID=UPI001EF80D30|nr:hypothetical protein [Rhizobium gallicum]ULJ75864.1 hypothetical protein L2W42_25525 [Rhizobium gallicum]
MNSHNGPAAARRMAASLSQGPKPVEGGPDIAEIALVDLRRRRHEKHCAREIGRRGMSDARSERGLADPAGTKMVVNCSGVRRLRICWMTSSRPIMPR